MCFTPEFPITQEGVCVMVSYYGRLPQKQLQLIIQVSLEGFNKIAVFETKSAYCRVSHRNKIKFKIFVDGVHIIFTNLKIIWTCSFGGSWPHEESSYRTWPLHTQGFQHFSSVPARHYLQAVLFIKIWTVFMNILYNTR